MRTSTRCDRGAPNWRTRFASSVKIFLTLVLLSSFLIPAKTFAQTVVIDGNSKSTANEWSQAGITHVADNFNLVNQDTIFGGSSKDFYPAGNPPVQHWTWVLGTAKDKNDIANGAAALVSSVDTGLAANHVTAGAPFLVFAGDRISAGGDAQIGFWFFQDGTAPVTGGYFSPDKHASPRPGDVLVLANFTNGGRNSTVTVLEWVGSGGNYADNAAFNLLTTTEAAVAQNNGGSTDVPTGWVFKDKDNNNSATNTTQYSANEFYEGYVALGNLFQGDVPVCFSRFMIETRSTHEITATLDDFVGGPLGGAPQPLVLTGSAACAGTTGTITSSTSVVGMNYQLYNAANVAVQGVVAGTGSGLSWSNIPIANGYYVITTNPNTHCTATSNSVNVTSVPNPTANAGPDQTLCQTKPSGPTVFTLAGTASNGTTAWSVVGSTGSAVATITTPSSLTSTVSVAGTGTVTLRLTTTSNTTPACGTATDDIVLTVNANPTANAGPDQTLCQTAPSGPTSFTLAGTASNGTTAWAQVSSTGTASASITTPSSLTSTVSVSGIGTVTLRLTTTSASCGTATDDVVLTVNANPTANAGPDQTKCQTAPSGPTSFTLAGTASNGTTAWSQVAATGTASASITDASSLTSTVSVGGIGSVTLRLTTTSGTGCGTATDEVVLTVNANPTANAGPDQTLCQTAPSGPTSFTLAGTASNGTTAWTQVGQTGTANASITTPASLTSAVSVSGIGTVTLRLTTTSASCGTATDDVVLTVNANPTANAGPDQTKCQTAPSGPTSFTLAGTASNGTTAWTQIASTGTASASITTPASLTSTVSVSGIGTVTLRLTTTSGTGCGTATDDVVLTVVANATNNAGPDQTLCQTAPSGPTMFTLAGTAANGTSTWSQFASTGTASASITTPSSLASTVSVSGIGTVTLRLTTVSDCGTVTDDVVLTVNANPTANAGPDQTLCQTKPSGPTSFTLAGTASNGTTAWTQIASTGSASASITTPASLTSTVSVSGIGTVTLRLTTTSGTGCGTATDDVVLTVNANPTANAGPDQTQCRNASGTNTFGTNTFTLAGTASNGTTAWSVLSNPQGYTVNIVTPTSLTSTVEISGSAVNGGSVTLRLTTTSASCGTATDDVVLTLNALPLIQTLTATNFCPNAATGGTVTLQNSQTGVSYQLQKDGSNYLAPQLGSTGNSISWSPVPAGTYTVVGTVIATSCNTTSGPADVAENSVPDPTADNKDVCVGSSVGLTGTPAGGTWSGAHVTGSTFDATGVAAGDYTVTYSVTNASGCTATVNATVHVHALPTPTADNKEVCEGATVDLTGSPAGGTWSGDHVTGSTFDATGVAAGDYTVTYTVTDEFGCTGSTTATVTVKTCGGPLCTYTQGYYGNTNGNSCDADGSGSGSITYQNPIALITAELNNGGTLTVGKSGRSVYLPVPTASTTATKLNSVMPGNSTPRELSYAGDVDINSATFNANYLNKQNRINNVLLSQTITLGLNMRISSGLPDLALQAGTLVTVAPDGPCGTTTAQEHKCVYNLVYPYNLISDNYVYKTFTADVITALNNAGYPLTVSGLFHLASDALGNVDGTVGSEDGATLASINAAVDAINTGFDGCRILVGWNITPCAPYNPPPAITTQSRTTASELANDNNLSVAAYPNPYTDVIKFTIQSNVSGRAQLEVVNMLGQRIATVYNGYIQAHKNQVVEYKVPSPAQQNLIYVLTIGNKKVTGKVLKANE